MHANPEKIVRENNTKYIYIYIYYIRIKGQNRVRTSECVRGRRCPAESPCESQRIFHSS